MSKIAWMGSLAAALLVSGCAVSGPSLLPGFLIMLDSPEEEEQQHEQCGAADCSQAKTTTDEEDESEQKASDSSQTEQAK